jgi:hypothetical protein
MLDLVELVSGIAEILLSWRIYFSFALAAGAIFVVIALVPNETARWIICTPIGLAGLIGGFYWQIKSERT